MEDYGDLTPKYVAIKLRGKEYHLREASADAARQYRNAIMSGGELTEGGRVLLKGGQEDSVTILVAHSLFEPNAEQPAFTVDAVRSWPNAAVERLFEKVKEISQGLVKELLSKKPPSAGATS